MDLGFAISEGTYNGIIKRGFSDQFMFTGPINPGMSGGPNVTNSGALAGVNVSHRLDGELVSFLVPVHFVKEILNVANVGALTDKKKSTDFNALISKQLLEYQQMMIDKLLETPLTTKTLGPYNAPVRESNQFRCWGSSDKKMKKTFSVSQVRCSMESQVFVSHEIKTGMITMNHLYTQSNELSALRFSQLIQSNFSKQIGKSNRDEQTPPTCQEEFVSTNNLPVRLVLCVRAFHKFEGIYDFTLLTLTTDEKLKNLYSWLFLQGVSYDSGLRVIRAFIDSLGKQGDNVREIKS